MTERIIPTNVDPETGYGRYEVIDDASGIIDVHEANPAAHEDAPAHDPQFVQAQFEAAPAPPSTEPKTIRRQREQREPRPQGRIRRRARIVSRVGVACLAGLGAYQIAGQFGFTIGDVLPGDKNVTKGSIDDVNTDVEEMHGIVTAELNSTVDIKMTRTLNHINPIPDCNVEVDENDIPLSGLLVVGVEGVKIVPHGDSVTATVSKFDTPKLGLPLDRPVLSNAFSASACVQKDGKEKVDSPENVPVILAGKLLKASSVRIGECVVNKANDEGSDVQRLLEASLQQTIADIRGIQPEQVTIKFDFEDSNEGTKLIHQTQQRIKAQQKKKAGAEVHFDTTKVTDCEAHNITTTLTSAPKQAEPTA